MVYIVFEDRTGEMIATINTDINKETVQKGFSILKGDLYPVLEKRPWEKNFPEEWESFKNDLE